MKYFTQMALALSVVTASAQATSLHPDTFRQDAAPVLKTVEVVEVGLTGKVIKSHRNHPYTTYLIAIPVTVQTPDVCTEFVGQEGQSRRNSQVVNLRAVGASSPVADACIQIAVAPVRTNLTIEMNVLTGGFVPADDVQSRLVSIETAGFYNVVLDMANETVRINPR